jgi:hypothetical protein
VQLGISRCELGYEFSRCRWSVGELTEEADLAVPADLMKS